MFTWLNSQAVRSDLGFEVECTGRFTIEYREGSTRLDVEIDHGFVGSKPSVSFSKDSFRVFGDKVVSSAERDRMAKNFADALEFQGLAVEVFD